MRAALKSIIWSLARFSFTHAFDSNATANIALVHSNRIHRRKYRFYYSTPPQLLTTGHGFRAFNLIDTVPLPLISHQNFRRSNRIVPICNIGDRDLFVLVDNTESTLRVLDARTTQEILSASKMGFGGISAPILCMWQSNDSGNSYLFLFGKFKVVHMLVKSRWRHDIQMLETFPIPIAGWNCAVSTTGKVFFADRDTLYSFQAIKSTEAPKIESLSLPDDEEIYGLVTYRSTLVDYLFVSNMGIEVYNEKHQHQGSIEFDMDLEGSMAILQTGSPDFPFGVIAVEMDKDEVNSPSGIAIGELGDALQTLGIESNAKFDPKHVPCHPCKNTICDACAGNGFCLYDEGKNEKIQQTKQTLCQCLPGSAGYDCRTIVCQNNCSDHGQCVGPNTCKCHSGWRGSVCSVLSVESKYEIETHGCNAGDPAAWISSTSPGESRVITTTTSTRGAGFNVFDPKGKILQHTLAEKPSGVNIVYNFKAGNRNVDLLFAICAHGVSCLFEINSTGLIEIISDDRQILLPIKNGLKGSEAIHPRNRGSQFVFANDDYWSQSDLSSATNGTIQITLVKTFKKGDGEIARCVADDETGFLFFVEQEVGIWRYDLNSDGSKTGHLFAKVGDGRLLDDAVGLSIIPGNNGKHGFLFVSKKSDNSFLVYKTSPPHDYVMSFTIDEKWKANIDRVTGTNGIAAVRDMLNEEFPHGLFVAQDEVNGLPLDTEGCPASYKLVSMGDILGDRLQRSLSNK
ncbi:thermostable phytase [Melanomma pulvis-pyrius CBS 109.77]|uniref:Thermostable phytase n=1 Tax=Melanomma pulvis-pyrius CBS 109.77 TaxID=1314802 RepID=A0A6A6WWD5_9PLEO|nr:thermostable phytase [Melanomma pulvis-pyrius CBS 109.77]